MTSTAFTVGTTRVIIIRADSKRKSFAVFNTHATNTVYIKEGSEVSTSNGLPVYSNGNLSMNELEDGESVKNQWVAISDGAGSSLRVFEGQ